VLKDELTVLCANDAGKRPVFSLQIS